MLQNEFHGGRKTAKAVKMPPFDACFPSFSGSGPERRKAAENLIQIMFGQVTTVLERNQEKCEAVFRQIARQNRILTQNCDVLIAYFAAGA